MAYRYTCPACGADIEVPYIPKAKPPPPPKSAKRPKRKRGK